MEIRISDKMSQRDMHTDAYTERLLKKNCFRHPVVLSRTSFLMKYVLAPDNLNLIECIESSTVDIKIKSNVNKRLIQVNNRTENVEKIVGFLHGKSSPYFMKIFVIKIIDQGINQVTINQDSFMGYSYLFHRIFCDQIFVYFKYRIFDLNLEIESVKGPFMIYIGILLLRGYDEEIFDLITSLTSSDGSLYILYSLLYVLKQAILNFTTHDKILALMNHSSNIFLKNNMKEFYRKCIE